MIIKDVNIPLRGKPKVYALNWLADIAHPSVNPSDVQEAISFLGVPYREYPHIFLVLTKWPEYLRDSIEDIRPFPNFYLGTSVSDQATADARIPHLMKFADKGWKTWLSIEPCLGPVILEDEWLSKLNQVIVGGETGKQARPLWPWWVMPVRDKCRQFGVPFYFKSWGTWELTCSFYGVDDEIKERALDKPHLLMNEGKIWRIEDGQPPTWTVIYNRATDRIFDDHEYNELAWRKA